MPIEGLVPSEILEGPAAIRATVAAADGNVRAIAGELRARGVRRVWVIGNGTSYHSSLHAAGLARRLAGPDDPIAIPVTAGDFLAFTPPLGQGDAIVGISASGEFRDVLGVFEEVRGRIPTVGIVHVPGSSLTRIADHVVLSAGGPSAAPVMTKTFSSTLSATILMLAAILGDESLLEVTAGLRLAADHAEQAIADAWPVVEVLAEEFVDAEHLFVVGGGLAYPAALEAALKLKEMALVHAEASETWEMATGPATMVGPGTVVVSLAPDGPARAATDDVVRHCRAWGARIIEVAPSRAVVDSRLLAVPVGVDERFAPLTVVPPVALLADVLARQRGATPDRPGWTERYHSQGLTHIVGG
jgi:glutamine---fructose-6-phosphate transaminase (isomerizing)